VIILTAVVVLSVWAIKKLGIKRLGPVQMLEEQKKENDQHNKSISCLHYMDEEIDAIDNDLRTECHQIILEYSAHMKVALREISSDNIMRDNLAANLKVILSGSVIRNHYTRELMPERFQQYRTRYLGQIEDFYRNLCAFNENHALRPWEETRKVFEAILDEWIVRVKVAVSESCEEKIDVYERYKKRFNETDPWYTVAEERRARNAGYIAMLKI
jgi:hypothetical protein